MTRYKSYSTYKSSGVEWLEKIPSNWSVVPLKRYCNYIARGLSPHYSENDEGIPVINQACIHWEGLKLENVKFQETSKLKGLRGKLFPGDLLINSTGTGTLGRVGIFDLKNEHLADSHVTIVRINKNLFVKFVYYLLQTDLYQGYVYSSLATGATNQIELSREGLGNTPIIIPTFQEQKLIVKFLDRETTRIDTLIAKKCELIKLLEKKRNALIAHAVTKGLDPNVPMKDSGISWIGKIPEYWSVMRLKFIMSNIVDCLHSTPTYDEDGEYIAIRTADISPGILDIHNAKRVNAKDYLERIARLKPQVGDIIYSREGERYGMATLVPPDVDLCLAQRVMMFRVSSSNDHTFMMWALNADCTYQQIKQDTVGATSPRVNIETIAEAWLSVPPIKEQQKIGAKISKSCLVIDRLIHTIKAHIEIIQKYRQALITAAVTGKIDVREEVERGAV